MMCFGCLLLGAAIGAGAMCLVFINRLKDKP